jgi:transmembrane sensor
MDPAGRPERKSLAEAVSWRVRLADARLATTPEFEAWLAQDAEHRAAWREAQASWASLDQHAADPAILALRREALARTAPQRPPRAAWRRIAASAVLALAAGGLGYAAWRSQAPATFRARHGATRLISLTDGSTVTLDSDSLLKVSFRPSARKLELVRGRALFRVAHDAARPFAVHAGDRTVVATGTSFEVARDGGGLSVVLIRGRVKVVPDRAVASAPGRAPSAAEVDLAPGQELTTRPGAPGPAVRAVDVAGATAWESGRLVFDNAPLGEVVEEVSRYTQRPVTTGDARAAALRISGTFKAGDLDTFVDAVTRYLPLKAEASGEGVVLRSRPAGAASSP